MESNQVMRDCTHEGMTVEADYKVYGETKFRVVCYMTV